MEIVLLRLIIASVTLIWGVALFFLAGLPQAKQKDPGVSLIRIPLLTELLYAGMEAVFLISQLTGGPGLGAILNLTIISEIIRLSMALFYVIFLYRHLQLNDISLKSYIPLKAFIILTVVNYLIYSLHFIFPGMAPQIRFITIMILTITFLYAGIGAITAVFKKNDLFKSTWAGFWIAAFSLTIYPFVGAADALAFKVPFLDPDRLVSMQTRPARLLVILGIVTVYWALLFMKKSSLYKMAPEELSDREMEVFLLLTEGKSNKLISEELNIALPTVKTHVSNVLRKHGMTARSQLIGINKDKQ